MITDSPHLYIQEGLTRGRSVELLERALIRAEEAEHHGLASVLTLKHLAHQTGADHRYLRDIVGRSTDQYSSFILRGKRQISSPKQPLQEVQRWILKNILNSVSCHPASFAYERRKSVVQCARRHLGAKWLVKLDVHDFFSSIDERQIFAVFNGLGYSKLVAFEMARICTRQGIGSRVQSSSAEPELHGRYTEIQKYRTDGGLGYLPQGSPTSGALANLVMRDTDIRISEAVANTGLVYTRYADDITFSTAGLFSRSQASELIRMTDRLLGRLGLIVHEKKTRIAPPWARKLVLGLLVDGDKLRLPVDARNRLLNDIRGVEKFGLVAHAEHRRFSSSIAFGLHIAGILAYCRDVNPDWVAPLWDRWMHILAENDISLDA